MPRASGPRGDLYYETEGSGETVAFVGDVGYGAWQWGWQHRAVAGPYESLVWDLRGTGRSQGSTAPEADAVADGASGEASGDGDGSDPDASAAVGDHSVGAAARDLAAVLSAHGAGPVHLVGAGYGATVALRYARDRRVETLTLLGATAGPGSDLPADAVDRAFCHADRPAAVRESLSAVLSAEFRERQSDAVDGIVEWRREEDAPLPVRRAQVAALRSFDATDWLYEVTRPALVVHGEADRTVPVANGRRLAEGLPRGRPEVLSGAGHLVGVERSRTVNDLLLGLLAENADGPVDD